MSRATKAPRRVTGRWLTLGAVTATLGLSGPLASPAMAADSCPNAGVRAQQHAVALPQCRAYEIVNRATNDLGDVNRFPFMSNDGTAVSYVSVNAADDAIGAGVVSISLARRGTDGWKSVSADPFATGVIVYGTGFTLPKAFSSDLSRLLVTASLPMTSADTDGADDLYRVNVGLGTSTWMSQDDQFLPAAIGASPDLGRVVYAGISAGIDGIQMSDGTSTQLITRYPDETPVLGYAPAASQYQRGLGVGGFTGGSTSPFVERNGAHGVSDDARRVYFMSISPRMLYVRDLTASPARTVPVGVSQRAVDLGTQHGVEFISASHDGGTAYVYSADQLTDAATPGGGIYRFDLATETVTQVTPDAGPGGLDLRGSIVSDDQSHIYFTSTAALAGAAVPGDPNAYVWVNGGAIRFIGKVSDTNTFRRVTPDGHFALFSSATSIAGAPTNGHDSLYRYDYTSDQVVCVSCRADGSPSNGDANVDDQSHGEPGAALNNNRALSFDGQVAFTTTDRLVPGDQTSAKDVYLYHDGTVSLLTAGRGDSDSFVGDISDDGKNVFIMTRSALVGADADQQEYDAYDVRVDGGFLEPPPASIPCHGDDCQDPPVPSGADTQPSSTRATGDGNVRRPKVAKVLSVTSLTATQRATLARTGKVALSVRVTGGGTVSVRGRGRIAGSTKSVGSVSEAILKKAATTVKLTFKLSTAARRELSRRHRLSVTLETRLSGLSKAVTRTINLTRAHR